MQRRSFLAASAASAIAGCTAVRVSRDPPTAENDAAEPLPDDGLNPPGIRVAGIRMLPVVGGKYQVWSKRIGSGPIKMLTLHGGAGFSHEYLEALESFLPQAGVELYYYDQLGCNNSDTPNDSTLWTMERYVEEVEEVRSGLGLDDFVLFGHSWGGMLAIDYALKYQEHLRGLVISNMAAGIQAFTRRTAALRQELLTADDHQTMLTLENAGQYDAPEYQRLLNFLYGQILCRTQPWPEPFTRTLRHANIAIFTHMFGPNEFVITGNQKDWERWERLHEIRVKTLTIGSRWDEMDPDDLRMMATMLPDASSVICPNGSHLCMYDDQEFYFRNLLEFLSSL